MDKFYTEKPIDNWDEAKRVFKKLVSQPKQLIGWIFRGHQDAGWELKTTLERAARDIKKFSYISEMLTVDKFQSIAHNYLPSTHIPDEDKELEWFALMQHYGAPTRILDFTESPYIAAFFAFEEYDKKAKNVAIWAFQTDWLWSINYNLLKDVSIEWGEKHPLGLIGLAGLFGSPTIFNVAKDKENIHIILPYIPSKKHSRLVTQQGAFLVPTNIEIGFEESIIKGYDTKITKKNIIKIVIPNNRKLRLDILNDLNLMNINSATLFPGLDGFARSLRLITEEQVVRHEMAETELERLKKRLMGDSS